MVEWSKTCDSKSHPGNGAQVQILLPTINVSFFFFFFFSFFFYAVFFSFLIEPPRAGDRAGLSGMHTKKNAQFFLCIPFFNCRNSKKSIKLGKSSKNTSQGLLGPPKKKVENIKNEQKEEKKKEKKQKRTKRDMDKHIF